MNWDKKAISNLDKGVELFSEEMADMDSNKHLFYFRTNEVTFDDVSPLSGACIYYGNPKILAKIICMQEDKFVHELCNEIFSTKMSEMLKHKAIMYNTKQFLKLEKCNKNQSLQAQETEYLKPKREGWIIRLIRKLNIFKS